MALKSRKTYMRFTKDELIYEIECIHNNMEAIKFHSRVSIDMAQALEKIVHPKLYRELLDKHSNGQLTKLGYVEKKEE